jgi:hypothetical protein
VEDEEARAGKCQCDDGQTRIGGEHKDDRRTDVTTVAILSILPSAASKQDDK